MPCHTRPVRRLTEPNMLHTRTIKVWRDIMAQKPRTMLVVFSIFCGVLGVVSLTTMGQLISRQLERDLRPSEMAMLRMLVEAPPGDPIDNAAVLRALQNQDTLTRVEGQAVYTFEWRKPGTDEFHSGALFAYSEPFEEVQLEPVRLLQGRYPINGQDEVAIEQRMADRFGLAIGDVLDVRTARNAVKQMRIVGIVFQPYLYIGAGDGSTSVYATYDDAQQIVGFTGFTSFYARFTNFGAALQGSGQFRNIINAETPYNVVVYVRTDPDSNPFLVSMRQFTQVLAALAIVVLIVACLLVANIINVMIAEQRRQIGTMKTLGATYFDILAIYLGLALAYGLLGTVPGIVAGVPLGQWAARQIAPLANTILVDTTPSWQIIILSLALGLLMPVLAAVIPVLNGMHVSILEAMTDQGIETRYGRGLMPFLVRAVRLPTLIRHVLNNIFRHKARLTLTFGALTAAAGAFMGVVVIVDTLDDVLDYVEDHLGYSIESDLDTIDLVNLRESLLMPEPIMAIEPGVAIKLVLPQMLEPGSEDDRELFEDEPLDITTRDEYLYVAALDPRTDALQNVLIEGAGWEHNPERRGIVLTQEAAQIYDKTLGDTILLKSPNAEEAFEIIGVADLPLEIGLMEWQQLRDFVGEIQVAPTPNAYWEQVQLELEVEDSGFENGSVWAVGIDEQVGQFLVRDFDPAQPGVIISRAVAQAGGWQVGDMIELAPADGGLLETLLSPPSATYPILAIVDITPAQLALVSDAIPPALREVMQGQPAAQLPVIAMDWQALAELVRLDYDALAPATIRFDLLQPAINETRAAARPVFHNQDSFSERVVQIMVGVASVMSFAALLLAVVGGVGLLTIMSVNVLERQREIGVMRSVGATSTEILKQFLLEGLLIGVGAWIAGLPLSYVISRVLITLTPYNDVIVFRYTLVAPVAGLVGMLLVTTLATFYPSIIATRKTVSEILRYK